MHYHTLGKNLAKTSLWELNTFSNSSCRVCVVEKGEVNVNECSEDVGEGRERFYRGKRDSDSLRRRWGSNGELMCWWEVERWERGEYREAERLDIGKTKRVWKMRYTAAKVFASVIRRSVHWSNAQNPIHLPYRT
ncbi:hypothetical protein HAX54_029679 [Datura stramonium]|uniref:Uncharacterized protein n=1 Tax=Datura stramonium TaxID=4076 RepID=A0ABS8V702_DATST|nr:hypothetical protein [Datura stramonium]